MIEQPHIRVGDRLTLRPWRVSDAPAVLEAFQCPEIQRWHVRSMDAHDEALAWIAGWPARWAAGTDASWAISRDGEAIGQTGLRHLSLPEAQAALSYWVLPGARGAGTAVRAAHALTTWTFESLGLHRVSLEHSTANAASCRVAAKLGFVLEGTLRGSGRHADGWHDMHLHACLRTDVRNVPAISSRT
jgi:RimJ/RimL family protein N-acetyltransferase